MMKVKIRDDLEIPFIEDKPNTPITIPKITTPNTPITIPKITTPKPVALPEKQTKNNNDMTLFKNTIVGKLVSKGASLGKTVAQVVTSPNPIQAASAALQGGVSSAKKSAVNETKEIQKASKQSGMTNPTAGGWWKNKKTLLGMTLPLWIWILIAVGLFITIWWLFKMFFGKKRGTGTTRRRTSRGSSSAKARMARVRSFRKKRK